MSERAFTFSQSPVLRQCKEEALASHSSFATQRSLRTGHIYVAEIQTGESVDWSNLGHIVAEGTREDLLVGIPDASFIEPDCQVLVAAVIQSLPGIVALQPHARVAEHVANEKYHVSLDLRASQMRG